MAISASKQGRGRSKLLPLYDRRLQWSCNHYCAYGRQSDMDAGMFGSAPAGYGRGVCLRALIPT